MPTKRKTKKDLEEEIANLEALLTHERNLSGNLRAQRDKAEAKLMAIQSEGSKQ